MPVRAEVGEVGAGVGEQVPADGEDRVADGDQGAFLAAALDDPLVAGGQEGAGPGGAGGGFADGAAEPGVALAGGGGFAASGGLAGLGRELGPGDQLVEALRLTYGGVGVVHGGSFPFGRCSLGWSFQ